MELRTVDPRTLVVNPENPRRSPASPAADAQMAASIQVVGIIQPPIVKQTADNKQPVTAANSGINADYNQQND